MEEQLSPLAVTHLLQHTLRSLCIHENSQWVYAVFWRILPRNYPPPKWDAHGAYDRSRGNRRNWILVWEDGFCNFAASSSTAAEMNSGECQAADPSVYGNCEFQQYQGLQPELFFKMSHEIYNYGEGLIGKVAADHSHKWIYKEPNDQEINFLSAWHNSADSHPRTWEAQFQSGIKTIALVAVREGVVQLGAVHKVIEDLSYVVMLRKKLSYIESIPGVLLPHPSSSAFPVKVEDCANPSELVSPWQQFQPSLPNPLDHHHHHQFYDHYYNHNINNNQIPLKITPSMSSLEALLSKLPSVVPPGAANSTPPPPHPSLHYSHETSSHRALEFMGMDRIATKEEVEDDYNHNDNNNNDDNDNVRCEKDLGEASSSMSYKQQHHHHFHHHQHLTK